ncbi:MAG: CRISPR system precrRNA processing endoribonuclease RAMP protein Cas6 [Bacilli bacterium]|jgi:CRISPR/Cas system endoribonuclease Cas6 (RAMP superfamily)|nr:CRISPR system precrRNA processing endoribonuclease RAMP protein Cas6 [Bacilli bacterium]
MESEGRLLSLALDLQYIGEEPVRASNWYGRAIQKYFIDALIDVGLSDLVDETHHQNDKRPYTASSLVGLTKSDKGVLFPGKSVWLRLTALSDEILNALNLAVQPGALMGIGTEITLDRHPFLLYGLTAEQPRGRFSSYKEIWERNYSSQLIDDCAISIELLSPTYFKIKDLQYAYPLNLSVNRDDLVCHLPLPGLFLQSLVAKWNTFAPPPYRIQPDLVSEVYSEVYPSRVELKSQSVWLSFGGEPAHHIGIKGIISYNTGRKTHPMIKQTLSLLLEYARFAGVGWDTTFGFGQCSEAFCERSGGC